MARTVAEIKQVMVDEKNATAALDGLTSSSTTAIYNLLFYVVAVCINIFEQLLDVFREEMELIALQAVPGTPSWLRDRVLKFQYGSVISLINFVPTYAVIDSTLCIVTRCAVKQSSDRRVTIKVAKGATVETLEPLDTPELNALKDYINDIKFAGTAIDVVSLGADRLKITAEILYKGQYVEATVLANVITAIEDYLAGLDFDGTVTLVGSAANAGLVDAIQAVEGVEDVILGQVIGRPELVAVDSFSTTIVTRLYESVAGYIIREDTSGHELEDTLTMTLV